MRITIDGRFFGPFGKGLGRYTQKLITEMEHVDTPDTFTVLLRKENWDAYEPSNPAFTKVLADVPWYSLEEQRRMPGILRLTRPDCVHFPHFNVPLLYRRPYVVTIHDLIITKHPTRRASTLGPLLYKIKQTGYTAVIRTAIRRARSIITVSQYVHDDIARHYPYARDRVHVTYEGCDLPQPKQQDIDCADRFGLAAPYLLYVGNAFPHKNLDRLIDAYASIRDRIAPTQLVLVGKEDYFYARLRERVRHAGLNDVIRFTGFASDGELAELYRGARGYVFPSLSEGFGLPPLEAMSYGIPVVAARASCLPEILDDAAAYIDPENVDDIARGMVSITSDETLRRQLIAKGTERVKRFTWQRTAEETVHLYHSLGL